jgi:outer membrane immunogenic protein
MKKHRVGLLAFTLTSIAALASANAADMYRAPEPFAGGYKDGPVYTSWAGFYVGAHLGGAWGDVKVTDFDEDGNKFTNSSSGLIGGGTIGYNFQRGNIVFGAEIDLGGIDLKHSKVNPINSDIVSKSDSGFYVDATARLGYSFGQTLVYAKGGYAFYDGSVSVSDLADPVTGKVSGLSGWTAGGGVEYKLNPAWSVKAEYQFFDFGTERIVISGGDRYDNDLTVHSVKAGVNYHFIPAYEPLK